MSTYTVGQVLWSLADTPRAMGAIDMDGEWVDSGCIRVDMRWTAWTVERVTPKGAWLVQGAPGDTIFGETVWVANNTRKVATTREQAMAHALDKRAYHVRMCAKRLAHAQTRLAALQSLKVSDGV